MSNQQNDAIYKASFEDFYDLYFTSDSFSALVNEMIPEVCDEWTKGGTALKIVFECLWNNDADLLVKDKRCAVEAYLLFKSSMKVFND